MALKDPVLEVVTVVGVVGCVVPSYLMVMVEELPKPVPDTVTLVPAVPLVGLRAIDGITVKMA